MKFSLKYLIDKSSNPYKLIKIKLKSFQTNIFVLYIMCIYKDKCIVKNKDITKRKLQTIKYILL